MRCFLRWICQEVNPQSKELLSVPFKPIISPVLPMIFKLNNKFPPPGNMRFSLKTIYQMFSGMMYSPGTLWHPKTRSKNLTSFRFLRDVRPKLYGDYWESYHSRSCHRTFTLNSHRKALCYSSSCNISDLLNGNRPKSLVSVELLRKERPKFYELPSAIPPDPVSNLPQPHMGADPIATSATVQHGSCHSNHGGNKQCQ